MLKTTSNMNSITSTDFKFEGQRSIYHGKVRDVYNIEDKLLVMVATDRISAFDVVLPRAIPFKGQVLNQVAAKFLRMTKDIVPNWLIETPDPNVSIGYNCEPFKVEMVIRGYLAGHAWREYSAGKRMICGVGMPEGLKENDKLPEPIITPTTKAAAGHDLDISREEILKQEIVSESDYVQMEDYTRKLFQRGTEWAASMNLILVDTKYEFGMHEGTVILIDEIHTPDSSRYFYLEGYAERQQKGGTQRQLSKEFVRQWLIANGFQGKEGQAVPAMEDAFVKEISERYIELFENISGEKFIKAQTENILERVEKNIAACLSGTLYKQNS